VPEKQRTEEGLFLAEGPKLAMELLNSDFQVKKFYATEEWIAENPIGMAVTAVTEIELEK